MTNILKAQEVPYSFEKSSSSGNGTCGGGNCATCCYVRKIEKNVNKKDK